MALACHAAAETGGRRRALLIGIDDYSASTLAADPRKASAPGRDWPSLRGSLNDVAAIEEMLVLLYGFDRRDILELTDQHATREAILSAIDGQLVAGASKGDVLFFYYAGHGSQVRNSRSDEPDELDESLVPADSRRGAPDIRDKELRPLFNRILDRQARLTVMIDSCHSGSGARGLPTGAQPRGVHADSRDVADAADNGPRPEDRGALVLSASQDFDQAWEARDDRGQYHGAFTWAWLRAVRDAPAGEAACETFQRAAARLRYERPYQAPVIAGRPAARLNPFLGVRTDRRGDRTVVAIEKVREDGTVVLQGGWANGLDVGTELQIAGDSRAATRLKITAVRGLGECAARITPAGRPLPQAIRSGALVEVVGWAAPPCRTLRVWMPRLGVAPGAITGLARLLNREAIKRGVRWVHDPIDRTPTHLLRRGATEWELLGPGGGIEHLGADEGAATAAIAKVPAGSSLFVQLPAPAALIDGISVGPGTDREGIEPAASAEEADYILVGRFYAGRLQYAWVRPSVRRSDRRKVGLPLRSAWIAPDRHETGLRDTVATLRRAVLALRKIMAWHLLESPPQARAVYQLGIRRSRDSELVRDGESVAGAENYELLLRAASLPVPPTVPQRYYYVFVIDADGRSTLLFPRSGSVENHFPLAPSPAPREIEFGASGLFDVTAPYGVDTYVMLSTDEPLSDPGVLEWDGVRGSGPKPQTPLEQLLMLTSASTRAGLIVTPSTWSIERMICESVPPRTRKHHPAAAPEP